MISRMLRPVTMVPIGMGILFVAMAFFASGGKLDKSSEKANSSALPLAIVGGTIIDGTGGPPLADGVILIEGGKIMAIARSGQISIPKKASRIDASGKYIIPGLIDGNAHFIFGTSVEYLARYEGRYEDLAEESAQVALKAGVTTAFDTWGPLQPLMNVRDRISREEPSEAECLWQAILSASAVLWAGTLTRILQ